MVILSITNRVEQNKGRKGSIILTILLVSLLIILIGALIYFLSIEFIPGKPTNLNPVVLPINVLQNDTFEEVNQFYPGMKFNHKEISYKIDSLCDENKKTRMIGAFEELSNKVSAIRFYETLQDQDITISCSEKEKAGEGDTFIAGEGGAEGVIPTGQYNIITNGTVILHGNPHGFVQCEWPNIELHELIHVFGFGHSQNPQSLMSPLLENCDQKLDESIINKLNLIYAEENLPDLYFEKISAIKKRKFLDFNLTVKNSGAVDALDVKLNIFGDDKLISTFDLGDEDNNIRFGAGLSIEITNLKLNTLNPKEIRFEVNATNPTEINKENNIAKITL